MVFRNTKALPKKHLSYNIMVSKFSDVAVGLSEDILGFRDYADGVIAIMNRIPKEDTPFTIAIFGSWGSGKTSFMQIMQDLLAEYLFSWENVPGTDRERLLRFLSDDINIGWAEEKAKISKSINGKTIVISKVPPKNNLSKSSPHIHTGISWYYRVIPFRMQ
uniref:KAP NTPase domain-containing protein n=1 Tax=Candidatus Methanophaga sp. ANME-1 ERB7 TaxID=2759913 RepID=A0A7G9ZBP4_9EURY|nr:hypothetical protein NMCMJOEM_00016 [Methanosarcinales archaeon ANME-1 ERB7]